MIFAFFFSLIISALAEQISIGLGSCIGGNYLWDIFQIQNPIVQYFWPEASLRPLKLNFWSTISPQVDKFILNGDIFYTDFFVDFTLDSWWNDRLVYFLGIESQKECNGTTGWVKSYMNTEDLGLVFKCSTSEDHKKVAEKSLRRWMNLYAQDKDFQDFTNSVHVMAIYDDHDLGCKWNKNYEHKKYFRDLFWKEFPGRINWDGDLKNHEGLYQEFSFPIGNLTMQIIMIDHYYMNAKVLLGESVYGEDQIRWLTEKLKVKADVRLITQGNSFVSVYCTGKQHCASPALYDLPKFEESHRQFFDLLSQTSGKIILGSGDWHLPHAVEYRHEFNGNSFYFLEILSSSMTMPRFMFDNTRYVREENRVLFFAPEDRQVYNWAKFTVDSETQQLLVTIESLTTEIASPMFSMKIDLDGTNLKSYEHVATHQTFSKTEL